MNSTIRITGMASGLDVDALVKQMMTAEKTKVDKLSQNRQVVQWKQDLYREIMGSMNTFKSTYFDVLKPDNYMLSTRNYSNYDFANLSTSPSINLSATGAATAGDYKVTVSKLAKKANITTSANSAINVEKSAGVLNLATVIDNTNKDITFTTDSDSYTVHLDTNNYYMSDLVNQVNSKLSSADGGDASKVAKAILSSDGNSIRMVAIKNIDATNNKFTVDISGKGPVDITIENGSYTFDDLAAKINSKLVEKGINNKLKAEVSATNDNIHFSTQSGVTETVKVNGTTIPNDNSNTIADNIFVVNMTTTSPASPANVLKYSRQIIEGFNDTISVKIDTTAVQIDLAAITYNDLDSDNYILSDLSSKITTQLGISGVEAKVSLEGDKIEFVSHNNNTVTVSGSLNKTIGFSSNFEINTSTDDKMTTLLYNLDTNNNKQVTFVINDGTKDVTFRYDFGADTDVATGVDPNKITVIGAKNKTINDIFNDISSKINAKLSYSQLTRNFTLESNNTGSSQSLSVNVVSTESSDIQTSTASFLTSLFGSAMGLTGQGEDAKVNIIAPGTPATGVDVIKSTNSFSLDGINYTLLKEDGITNTISVTSNPQKSFDKIKAFVDKYNEIIDKINTKLSEKKQYSYKPLTYDQKKDMKDDEIKTWEEKAKEGLLSNDSTLSNMLYSMRSAFYEPVKGNYADSGSIGISMSDIGITTSSDVSQRGKLIIDETKLKDALQNKGDKVMQLFTKTSTTVSSYNPNNTATDREHRYKELGIFQRISDILQDNLRTMRDNGGRKGVLLEKAGIKGDFSEFHNILTDDMVSRDKIIKDMTLKLADKENKYYLRFSKLETAMQKLNSQSSWLSQQLNSSNG